MLYPKALSVLPIALLLSASVRAELNPWQNPVEIDAYATDAHIAAIHPARALVSRKEVGCTQNYDDVPSCTYRDTFADATEVVVTYIVDDPTGDLTSRRQTSTSIFLAPTLAPVSAQIERRTIEMTVIDQERSQFCDPDYALEHACDETIVYKTVPVTKSFLSVTVNPKP